MLYIGIDLGTSSVKALLIDESGEILSTVSREYSIAFPRPGWSEQNPQDWWDAVCACIRKLTGEQVKNQIAGIGVAGQMHGLVALDEADRVIRPAILWNDGRSWRETDYLNTVIGKDKLSQWTGNIAFAGFTAPKLLWMKANEPENFARIAKIMLPKDYIVHRLTGVHASDMTDASGLLLLDVKKRRWSDEMLELCGISEKKMPRLFESFETVGTLNPSTASLLGLPTSVRVIAGAGDNAAAAIGTDTLTNGSCNISIGTSGTAFIACDSFAVDPNNALHAFAHSNGKYHLMGCMLSAASCGNWWVESILQASRPEEQANIPNEKLGLNPVYFLPYLMGERSPHNDPHARGTFIGMSMETKRSDMTLAVLEGVAFGIRDSVEIAKSLGIPITRSKLCGGGAKSSLWRKIFANVLNMELDTVVTEEGPGMGAAILAAVACGEFGSVEAAANAFVSISGTEKPNADIAGRYEISYQKFRKIYPQLKSIYPEITL